ncbi:MAG: LytTR family DNA-binding domain-containing protein [Steroidobacteraceae bacterium]|jgi:two-component system LytT family response regulator|nr:LytTR family DNA-binding domain-containing protein [Steroidobacteraceae bacterium]
MTDIRALIVDDEPPARRGLQIRLADEEDIVIVGEAGSGRLALEKIRELSPDLVFLDIEMPGMTGFDVIGQLPMESMPLIVFVTAYDRYAVRAFEARAIDYLLKPVEAGRLSSALKNVRERLTQRRAGEQRDRLVELMADLKGSSEWPQGPAPGASDGVLSIREGRDIVRVRLEDIEWVDAAGDYMCVHATGRTHILRGTMKSLEDALDPARFQRVHRSTIVNLHRVTRLRSHMNGEYFLVLEGGHELKLSRSFRDKVELFLGARREA